MSHKLKPCATVKCPPEIEVEAIGPQCFACNAFEIYGTSGHYIHGTPACRFGARA